MSQLARIRIYPIKSCRGYDVTAAHLDTLGLAGDRRFQVVNLDGKPFTQRSHPVMATVTAALHEKTLDISAEGVGRCMVSLAHPPAPQTTTTMVWGSTGLQADLVSSESDQFFSQLLGESAILVRTGSTFNRPIKNHDDRRVGFADAYPLLILSEASLASLNERLIERGSEPMEMERFRPNLIVADCGAHEEDTWAKFTVGGLPFRGAGPCERCIMTAVDPLTGERSGSEPLATLATYRRGADDSGVIFGQNVVHDASVGTIRVGDPIAPLPRAH